MDDDDYQRHLENLQASGSGTDYTGSNVMSDDAKLRQQYIHDDLFDEVANGILEKMCLKKKTANMLKLFTRMTTSNDVVLGKLNERGIYREKLGNQLGMVFLNMNVSALERKYCDINVMDVVVKIHHATKLGRSVEGFERNAQTQTISSHTQRSILEEKKEPPKSGFSRQLGRLS